MGLYDHLPPFIKLKTGERLMLEVGKPNKEIIRLAKMRKLKYRTISVFNENLKKTYEFIFVESKAIV